MQLQPLSFATLNRRGEPSLPSPPAAVAPVMPMNSSSSSSSSSSLASSSSSLPPTSSSHVPCGADTNTTTRHFVTSDLMAVNAGAAHSHSQNGMDGIRASSSWWGVSAHQGPRPCMQDSFSVPPPTDGHGQQSLKDGGAFFTMSDGHGRNGHIVAALTTALLPKMFHEELLAQLQCGIAQLPPTTHSAPTSTRSIQSNHSYQPHQLKHAMERAFERMERHVLTHTNQGGTTVLAAHLSSVPSAATSSSSNHIVRLTIAHVGDTRAVLCRGSHAQVLTQDHRADVAEERRAIEARGGCIVQRQQLQLRPQRPTPITTPRPVMMPQGQMKERTSDQPSPETALPTDRFAPFSAAFSSSSHESSHDNSTPQHPSANVVSASTSASTSSVPSPSAQSQSQCAPSWRVEGLLNLSRSIGDAHLKHLITAIPTVSIIEVDVNGGDDGAMPSSRMMKDGPTLHAQTDVPFLILATDGVWNHLAEQEAMEMVRRLTKDQRLFHSCPPSDAHAHSRHLHGHAHDHDHDQPSRAALAADLLVRTALDRGSQDNASCTVIFLQAPS